MKHIVFILFLLVLASSCTINKNVMFKTDQDFAFDQPDSISPEYVISENDVIKFKLYSNNGADLVNFTASSEGGGQARNMQSVDITYTVEPTGMVKFPEIGHVEIAGMTLVEAQKELENRYNEYHNDSYVLISVVNNRVVVFPGSGGDAKVIILENNNTTVIEALALAGGIADRGDASKVKLIRKTETEENKIYEMDLSTIEGIQYAQMIVQANDIIYVEPVPEIASEAFKDASPFIQLISGVALIWAIVTSSIGGN